MNIEKINEKIALLKLLSIDSRYSTKKHIEHLEYLKLFVNYYTEIENSNLSLKDKKQKKEELDIFVSFSKLLKLKFTHLNVIGESPDFTFYIDNKNIGLEVTQLPNSAEISRDSVFKKICEEIIRELNPEELDLYKGQYDFELDKKLDIIKNKENVKSAMQSIIKEKSNRSQIEKIDYSEGIIKKLIYSYRSKPLVTISQTGAHMVPNANSDLIIDAIKSKAIKIENYTYKCDEPWLLIFSPANRMHSSLSDFISKERLIGIESQFEKIFFLNCDEDELEIIK